MSPSNHIIPSPVGKLTALRSGESEWHTKGARYDLAIEYAREGEIEVPIEELDAPKHIGRGRPFDVFGKSVPALASFSVSFSSKQNGLCLGLVKHRAGAIAGPDDPRVRFYAHVIRLAQPTSRKRTEGGLPS